MYTLRCDARDLPPPHPHPHCHPTPPSRYVLQGRPAMGGKGGDHDENSDDDAMPEEIAWNLEDAPAESSLRRRRRRRRVWEAGVTTEPLEYPTAAVRRGVVKFHEQVRCYQVREVSCSTKIIPLAFSLLA